MEFDIHRSVGHFPAEKFLAETSPVVLYVSGKG